ncbi:ferrous iron transport protein B [Pontibacter sp. G13]|uniref:ferrous iron transport protein B n=1 Tax=Pontibacter sp. G13 TaxID=3074898 RepID=UPI00288AF65B|nr:ferrous iron transport protein B [Pontibacter sp. G13]WNJ17085.1 ferrous iron transport protein B [Pontibacter sp. G13]
MDQPPVSRAGKRVVALVGNPNCGKTSLFNALSGLNQRVGNFPGVTVERKSAHISLPGGQAIRLVDLPGTQSLYPNAEDEAVTCQVLQAPNHPDKPDQVVVVVDGTQLRRGLMLATQVMDLGYPTLLAVNMMDLVEKDGIRLDLPKLSKLMGIPVVGISVRKNTGIDALKTQLAETWAAPKKPMLTIPAGFRPVMQQIQSTLQSDNDYLAWQIMLNPKLAAALGIAEIPTPIDSEELSEEQASRLISNELLVRLDRADGFVSSVQQDPANWRERATDRFDQVLTHPIWGYVIFMGILLLIFQSIFSWADVPMGWIEGGMGFIKDTASAILPDNWIGALVTEGILTGFEGIIIFIPQIAILFFFISIMEESGYMSRVVFLMDRIMRPFGFSGMSVIPLMGGMACAVPSIMMTRNIPSKVERLITMMVTPLMSCSARIPVYTLLIAMFVTSKTWMGIDQRGIWMAGLYLLGFVMSLAVAFVFKKAFKYESSGMFVMELPAYRMPRWKNVGLSVFQKSMAFVTGAGKIILSISIVLWFLLSYGPGMDTIEAEYAAKMETPGLTELQVAELDIQQQSELLNHSYAAHLGHAIEPVIKPLGYDWKIGISLIASFAAREVFVSTMSIIYQQDDPDGFETDDEQMTARSKLIHRLQAETWEDGSKVYTPGVVLSLLIFYAFAMQCMSTLAVTKKEAGWKWMWVMLLYLTVLAYVAAWLAYMGYGMLA